MMSSAFIGMDTDKVAAMGKTMQVEADKVARQVIPTIDRLAGMIPGAWHGPDADRFKTWWLSQHRPQLVAAATDLHGLGQSAIDNAAEQIRTSHGSAGGVEGDHHIETRTIKSGAITKDIDGVQTEVYREPNGKWILLVTPSSSWEIDPGAAAQIAEIATAGGIPLVELLSHGSLALDTFGKSDSYSVEFDNEHDAELYQKQIQDHAESITNTGIVDRRDLENILIKDEKNSEFSGSFTPVGWQKLSSAPGITAGATLGAAGVAVSSGGSSIGYGSDESGSYDVAIAPGNSLQGSAAASTGPTSVQVGAQHDSVCQIVVYRSPSGAPTRLVVESTRETSVSGGGGISVAGNKDTSSATAAAVQRTTTTYDLTDPRYAAIAKDLPSGSPITVRLTGDELAGTAQRAGEIGGGQQTTESIAVTGTTSEKEFMFSYDNTYKNVTEHVTSSSSRDLPFN